MSTYEKIGLALIALIAAAGIFFSYHEVTEPRGPGGTEFDESIGSQFRIGTFDTLVSRHSSGGAEDNCAAMQPVIVAVLHDITVRLEELTVITKPNNKFRVDKATLQLLCDKQADVTLSDASGNHLLLQKVPFVRMVPPGHGPEDIGTDVKINATVIPAGAALPPEPTTFGEELIPDRQLDDAPSSRQ